VWSGGDPATGRDRARRVVEGDGDRAVIGAQRLLADGKRALVWDGMITRQEFGSFAPGRGSTIAALAQKAGLPQIGRLGSTSPSQVAPNLTALRQACRL